MNMLLSAYACEPFKGSEPGVGWNWAIESSKSNNTIWMLTRKNNKPVIDRYFLENEKPKNLNFIYYDLPSNVMFIKRMFGIYLYYLLWQIGAFFLVKNIHKKEKFDQVNHVTFVTIRQPSFMGFLGIPFIYGPVGGGESPPYHLIKSFPLRPKIKEVIRLFANWIVKLDPLMHLTFLKAKKIVVTSQQTKDLIASFYTKKVIVKLAIAQSNKILIQERVISNSDCIKLLFVGRFEYWKGVHLCIKSLSYIKNNCTDINVKLTLVGEGAFRKELIELAKQLGVSSMIDWCPWVSQSELDKIYIDHDLFVFPSLHDSGGMVVLEALATGMPVVCLNLGGPATIVTNLSGEIVDSSLPEDQICEKIAQKIELIVKPENYPIYVSNAKKRAKELTWQELVSNLL